MPKVFACGCMDCRTASVTAHRNRAGLSDTQDHHEKAFSRRCPGDEPAGSRRALGAAELHSAGFLGHLGPFVLAEFRAAGIRPGTCYEPITVARRTASWREQPERVSGRLHQPYLEALGSGCREEARRGRDKWSPVANTLQSALASRGAVTLV